MADGGGTLLRIRTLGKFEVSIGGTPVPEDRWPRRKTRDVLKVLLTDPGKPFAADQLVEALLPGADISVAAGNIQARVSELRRVLEPQLSRGRDSKYIRSMGEGYAFDPICEFSFDVREFEAAISEAESLASDERWQEAAEMLEQALLLRGGDFLAEDRYAEWAEETRSHLRQRYLEALSSLTSCYVELGRLRQAIDCCQTLLTIEPYRESAIRQLMTYQFEIGQRAGALRTFEDGVQALRAHLDVAPSEATCALREQIAGAGKAVEDALDPRRLAVLPFDNYSADSDDAYLSDGLTEELIGTISMIKDLRVIARTSVARYRGTSKSISQIASELNVGTILEGSIRRTARRIRISAQLIDAATEDHLWAEHFTLEHGDLLEMQAIIARRVSKSLALELLPVENKALQLVERSNSEAHMAYLKGRHFLQMRSRSALETAIGHFECALQIDPTYAHALAGLADVYCRMEPHTSTEESYRMAKAYAEQALALDDSLPEVYSSLAIIAGMFEDDLEKMEELLHRAIQLDPTYALARARLAELLAEERRWDEAVKAARTALVLDPASAHLAWRLASCLFGAGRYIEAIERAGEAVELDPENEGAWWIVWFSHAALWDWSRGEELLREMVKAHPTNPLAYLFLSVSAQTAGRMEEGFELLEKALSLPGAKDRSWVLHQGGLNLMMAGQYDRALSLLDEAVVRWPTHCGVRIARAFCFFLQGRFDECLGELQVADQLPGWMSYGPRLRGRVYAALGETAKAETELKTLMDHPEYPNQRICIAYVLAGLGRVEEAIDWFEKAADAHEIHIATVRKLPTSPPELLNHPRFNAFLRRVGLTDGIEVSETL